VRSHRGHLSGLSGLEVAASFRKSGSLDCASASNRGLAPRVYQRLDFVMRIQVPVGSRSAPVRTRCCSPVACVANCLNTDETGPMKGPECSGDYRPARSRLSLCDLRGSVQKDADFHVRCFPIEGLNTRSIADKSRRTWKSRKRTARSPTLLARCSLGRCDVDGNQRRVASHHSEWGK
jgi:hypothetical protein